MNQIINIESKPNSEGLQLSKITLDEKFAKEYNERSNDFFVLTMNGVLIRETLYRIGGINYPKVGVDNYFKLLKHTPSLYTKRYPDRSDFKKYKNTSKDKHLHSEWVVLDKYGNELYTQPNMLGYISLVSPKYPLITESGSVKNILNGEVYGDSKDMLKSDDFLFINKSDFRNRDLDGVVKLCLKDFTTEFFPRSNKR